jgi:glycosyltransferase involved in cell wall biosynthesis
VILPISRPQQKNGRGARKTVAMKIVMVCGFAMAPKATVSARAVPMGQSLVDRGHEVTILISPYDNPVFSGKQTSESGVSIKNLRIGDLPVIKHGKIPLDFLREIHRIQPDIVHIFKPKGFAGLTAMLLPLMKHGAFVLDHDDWEGWGGWNEFTPYSHLVKEFIAFQERWIPRRARAVTVASRTLAERLAETGVKREKIHYVPNGPRRFLSSWVHPPKDELERLKAMHGFEGRTVVWLATHMNAAENPLDAIQVCEKVLPENPNVRFWIAGSGPLNGQIKSYLDQAGLSPEIVRLGWLDYTQYLRYVAASDLVYYPYPDTPVFQAKCSGKMIEYMCLGKAVVTNAVGQNPEYLENGVSGILLDDLAASCKAICDLAENPSLRIKLGQNAKKRIWEKFDWSRLVESVEHAYLFARSDA